MTCLVDESLTKELWLVFENEGFSLTHFLFKTQPGSQVWLCESFPMAGRDFLVVSIWL